MSERLTETERRRRKAVLDSIMQDLDRAGPSAQRPTDGDTADSRKTVAAANGLELLTPLAACDLFSKSPPTVRRAVSHSHVYNPFVMHLSDKPVRLIDLSSAIAYWDVHSEARLDEMRANGTLMWIDERSYNILHPTPLVTRGEQDEEEEEGEQKWR